MGTLRSGKPDSIDHLAVNPAEKRVLDVLNYSDAQYLNNRYDPVGSAIIPNTGDVPSGVGEDGWYAIPPVPYVTSISPVSLSR